MIWESGWKNRAIRAYKAMDDPREITEFCGGAYQVLWVGYGNAKVTLRELAGNADEYRTPNKLAAIPEYSSCFVSEEAVAAVLSKLGIDDRLAEAAWLICAVYLAPGQAARFSIDPKTSRQVLVQAAYAARQLERAFNRLPPQGPGCPVLYPSDD